VNRRTPWAVFALRLAVGGLLAVAGALKAHDGGARTATTIAGYRLLPAPLDFPLGVALPYLEIFLGLYLIVGLFTRGVAWIATAQFLVFATAVASLLLRHIAGDCGCFGSVLATPPSWWHVAGDLALASATAFIALHAPGSVAFDRRLEASGPPETSGELETT